MSCFINILLMSNDNWIDRKRLFDASFRSLSCVHSGCKVRSINPLTPSPIHTKSQQGFSHNIAIKLNMAIEPDGSRKATWSELRHGYHVGGANHNMAFLYVA
ncbi:hypothetical protein L6452_11660 [Arctium lappa]|uniref:Uncharacterized protein n=1 Tax=Arctium lappa TaxID=4217 RepID=A0ACB9DPX2_ARCLA|nr:hypothetical protein L6452_11660 [Arctium lappa]